MSVSQAQLEGAAADSGFQLEALEKVLRLVELLEALRSHPFLKERIVLKGGTALNLFVLDLPRLSFVVYGGMSRRDWREVSIDEVRMDPRDADRKLLPLLRENIAPARRDVPDWCASLTEECREHLSAVLPLEPRELGFLDRLRCRGEIVPELLTDDADLRERIRTHPGLLWRALNIPSQPGEDT